MKKSLIALVAGMLTAQVGLADNINNSSLSVADIDAQLLQKHSADLICYSADANGKIYDDVRLKNIKGQWIRGGLSIKDASTSIFLPAELYSNIKNDCDNAIQAAHPGYSLTGIFTTKDLLGYTHDIYFTNSNVQTAYPFSRIIAFGDSLSDNSNDFRYFPSLMHVGGSPGYYWDMRFSNGLNWADWLSGLKVNGINDGHGLDIPEENYAFGGAYVTGTRMGIVPGMDAQVDEYLAYISNNPGLPLQQDIPKTLFSLLIGANDFLATDHSPALVANVVQEQINKLISKGAVYFLIPKLPNLGVAPNFVSRAKVLSQDVATYNNLVDQEIAAIQAAHPNVVIFRPDLGSYITTVMQNPALGLHGTTRCMSALGHSGAGMICNDPQNEIFWDGTHPNSTVSCYMGQKLTSLIQDKLNMPETFNNTSDDLSLVNTCRYTFVQPGKQG